jgi:hypothetical protein
VAWRGRSRRPRPGGARRARCDYSRVGGDDEKRALRDEAQAWVAFWRDSRVKDARIDEETINVILLRYYNAGALTEDDLNSMPRQAGVQPFTMGTTRHPQARIEHAGKSADVDEQIAPLLLELWRANLWTIASCQDLGGRVSIEFEDGRTAETFLNLVAGERSSNVDSIYNRIIVDEEPDDWEYFRRHRIWEYGAGRPIDYAETGPPDFEFWGVAVRFPRGDLDEVLRRVRDFNAAQKSS